MERNANRIALLTFAVVFIALFSPFSPAIARAVIDRFFPERLLPTTGLVAPNSDSVNQA